MRVAKVVGILAMSVATIAPLNATSFTSFTPVFSGASATFEGLGEGTLVSNQYAGLTFSQVGGGRPQSDVFDWLFGYGSSSGSTVLTGSTEGGLPVPTVAGIVYTFDTLQSMTQFFFSDSVPLGNYPVQALDSSGNVLETLTILQTAILPPGYSGGIFPPPGTTPLPGLYAGFVRPSADIKAVRIGPSSANLDAFAIDDVLLPSGGQSGVPEPASMALLGFGLAGLAFLRRRRL